MEPSNNNTFNWSACGPPPGFAAPQPTGYYPLPPLAPGYQWAPMVEDQIGMDGYLSQVITGYRPVFVGIPFWQTSSFCAFPQTNEVDIKTSKAAEAMFSANNSNHDDDGEFGFAAVDAFNPFAVNNTDDKWLLLANDKKAPACNVATPHEKALKLYRNNRLKKHAYPYSYYEGHKNYFSPAKDFKPQAFQNSRLEYCDHQKWWDAAVHFLPLGIIDHLEEMVCLHSSDTPGSFAFRIPCSAICTNSFYGRVKQIREEQLKNACIELVLSEKGQPIHFFMRPLEGKTEAHLLKHLADHKDNYENAQNQLHFPSLREALSTEKPYLEFESEYGLTIRIPKRKDI